MSVNPCLTKLRKYKEDKKLEIPDEDLVAMAAELEHIQSTSKNLLEQQTKIGRMVKTMTDYEAARTWDHTLHIEKLTNAFEVISSAVEKGEGVNKRGWTETVIDFYTGGARKLGDGLSRNPHRVRDSFFSDLVDPVNEVLKDILPVVRERGIDKHSFIEMHAIENNLPPGASGSAEAVRFAKAMHESNTLALRMKQAYNPAIKKIDNYYVHIVHDREKVAAAGFDKWFEKAAPAYWRRSYPGLNDEEKLVVFKDAHARMAAGIYDTSSDFSSLPRDLLKKTERHRTFLFDDPVKAAEYHAAFGKGSVYDSFTRSMYSTAHTLSLTEKMGNNIKQFAQDMDNLVARKATPEERAKYQSRAEAKKREMMLDAVIGEMDSPADGPLAEIAQTAMTLKSLGSTGQAWLASLPDLAMMPLRLSTSNGRSFMSNAASVAGSYLKDFLGSTAEKQALLRKSFILVDGTQRDIMVSLGEGSNGTLGTLANKYHSVTFLKRHIDTLKFKAAQMASNDMADFVDTPYAMISESVKRDLLRTGFGEAELNLLKFAKDNLDELDPESKNLGLSFVTTKGVLNLPDEEVAKYLTAKGVVSDGTPSQALLDRTRFELKNSLAARFNAIADAGTSTADLKSRATLLQGHSINSASGVMWRMFAQFKSAAVASYENARYSYYSGTDPARGNYAVLGQAAVMSLFYASMSAYIVDAVTAGKKPQDPRELNFFARVAANSGLGNIWGGVVSNELSQGGSAQQIAGRIGLSLLGPVPSTVIKAGAGVISGVAEDPPYGRTRAGRVAQNEINLLMQNIPGQNLWATKAAFQYYLSIPMRNFFSHGAGDRIQSQTESNKGLMDKRQKYFMTNPGKAKFPWE